MSKVTQWFPANIKPVHIGLYNASIAGNTRLMRLWNGRYWSRGFYPEVMNGSEIKRAKKSKYRLQDCVKWRGLAEKPE